MTPSSETSIEEKDSGLPVAGAMLCGMAASQVIATLQVYLSNIGMYEKMHLIAASGYLPVPNVETLPLLREAGSAFWGGLFFTLTVGAFLSLLAVCFAWVFVNVFRKGKWGMAAGLIGWGLLLVSRLCGVIGSLGIIGEKSSP